jgi:hypothetical protein
LLSPRGCKESVAGEKKLISGRKVARPWAIEGLGISGCDLKDTKSKREDRRQ